jgi:hypothetical protein
MLEHRRAEKLPKLLPEQRLQSKVTRRAFLIQKSGSASLVQCIFGWKTAIKQQMQLFCHINSFLGHNQQELIHKAFKSKTDSYF